MAFILRRPGTIVREELDDIGVGVSYRVPDAQTAAEVQRAAMQAAKNPEVRLQTFLRIALGALIESIDGVDIDGASEYTPEKDKSGRLTEESLELLLPLTPQLQRLCMDLVGLNDADRKN